MSEFPVISADVFEMFRDLLSLVANEKRAMRLLNALEDRLAKIADAGSKLEAAREAHNQKVARDREELENKASKLRSKEISLAGREQISDKILERERADRIGRARPLSEANSITREA